MSSSLFLHPERIRQLRVVMKREGNISLLTKSTKSACKDEEAHVNAIEKVTILK